MAAALLADLQGADDRGAYGSIADGYSMASIGGEPSLLATIIPLAASAQPSAQAQENFQEFLCSQ